MSSRGSRIQAVISANLRASPGKVAVLGVCTVVLALLLIRLAGRGPRVAVAEPAGNPPALAGNLATGTAAGMAAAPAARPAEPRVPVPRVRQTIARDPFSLGWLGAGGPVTVGAAAQVFGDLTLQLVLRADDKDEGGLAVISGVLVHPGSQVGGCEVVQIAARHVVLRSGTETVLLRMP